MLTFLIAGHETTSGMLSFAMTHILNDPKVYGNIRQEVDTVLGREPIRPEHLTKLPYITGWSKCSGSVQKLTKFCFTAVLRESLRLTPSISQFTVAPHNDETIGNGKYRIKKGTLTTLLATEVMQDAAIWGEDVSPSLVVQ